MVCDKFPDDKVVNIIGCPDADAILGILPNCFKNPNLACDVSIVNTVLSVKF